jgi:hypothetical protein
MEVGTQVPHGSVRAFVIGKRGAETEAARTEDIEAMAEIAKEGTVTFSSSPRPLVRDSGFVESDGMRIYFEDFGSGEPIILVHGWGSNLHANWVRTGWVDALLPVRRVVALDVRGHGASDKPHHYWALIARALHRSSSAGLATRPIRVWQRCRESSPA